MEGYFVIVEIYVKELYQNKLKGFLLKVNDKVLSNKTPINLSFDDPIHSQIIVSLNQGVISASLEASKIIAVSRVEEVNVVDSSDIIVKIVKDSNNNIDKKVLYDEYVKLTNLSKRSAINHVQEAIKIGKIKEDGYYKVKL